RGPPGTCEAAKSTPDSSGDATMRQIRALNSPPIMFAALQVVPLFVERNGPSGVQMSTMPPACATTPQTSPASSPGVGSMNVHVAPESVLRARPQFVPMKTLFVASGRIAMPNADGSPLRAASQLSQPAGVALAGFVHVTPASLLTLMPALLAVLPS